MLNFYEFFAGAGMVRAGLDSPYWKCVFANDFDHKKGFTYRRNWGEGELHVADVGTIKTDMLPGRADLAWASFPCQDLSLAGGGAGLKGDRSGTFWPFWRLMTGLISKGRAPKLIALENVCGTLTSHNGRDFESICDTFVAANYRFGAMVIDAAHFVPQSRPRLFVIGVHDSVDVPNSLCSDCAGRHLSSRALLNAYERLPQKHRGRWLWWALPHPPARNFGFAEILEENPTDVRWLSDAETQALIAKMAEPHLLKLEAAKRRQVMTVGAVYKRTRIGPDGLKHQRAEVRFDDVAGCLRTPAGGSSRQLILIVRGDSVRARLVSGRETARLMGLPEFYQLPSKYNETYHLTGDGVVVPVVRYLAENLFEPLLSKRFDIQDSHGRGNLIQAPFRMEAMNVWGPPDFEGRSVGTDVAPSSRRNG